MGSVGGCSGYSWLGRVATTGEFTCQLPSLATRTTKDLREIELMKPKGLSKCPRGRRPSWGKAEIITYLSAYTGKKGLAARSCRQKTKTWIQELTIFSVINRKKIVLGSAET